MRSRSIIKVAEWLFDKIDDATRNYGMILVVEYDENDMADHTKLRVEEVLAETEKAYKVALDAETLNGTVKTWTAWIPKSAIVEM